jgi:ACS family hexuronate transporter-like MFS transporter
MLPGRAVCGLASATIAVGAYRTLAEWLPRHFHGTAVALFRGAYLALGLASPYVLIPMVQRTGWRSVFIAAGVWGILLAGVWAATYIPRPHARPVDTLREGEAGLVSPVSWALILGLVLIAPLQVFLFTWLPVSLRQAFHQPDSMLQVPTIVSLVALLAAGLFSDLGIQLGASAGRSRGITLIVAGVMMAAIGLLGAATSPVMVIVILSVAMAGFQAWNVILYSALLDAVPPGGVAMAAGLAMLLAAVMQSVTLPGFYRWVSRGEYAGTATVIAFLALAAISMAALVWRIPPEEVGQAVPPAR